VHCRGIERRNVIGETAAPRRKRGKKKDKVSLGTVVGKRGGKKQNKKVEECRLFVKATG